MRGILIMCVSLSISLVAPGATYYVSASGSDEHDGKSRETAWATTNRVNAEALKPGDTVLFKRGDVWRGQIRPSSGSEEGIVTYGAFGEGPKPLFLGSVEKNRPEDWSDEGNNVWSTSGPQAIGPEILPNPSFSEKMEPWSLHCEGGARADVGRDTESADSLPASCRIRCAVPGNRGSDVQFYVAPFRIEQGKSYRLQVRAKSNVAFPMPCPVLMKAGPPWSVYARGRRDRSRNLEADWSTFEYFYQATHTADDARWTFFLGDAIPKGATLWLDSMSLTECGGEGLLLHDVGNIIFDGEKSCGVKVFNPEELKEQDQYWYDEESHLVKIYSVGNPASVHSDIECALMRHLVDQSNAHHVTYENLAFKYGAAHGVGGGNTHHITVRDCDFGYIGGGDQMGGDKTVRFGNGVEFWGSAHDCLVERCRLWEIYDAALTNQSSGPKTPHYNIRYRHNVIWNSEYSFEYWNRPEESETHDIYFENNTCVNAGHGWGHTQRPDPSGRHLCFYTSPARASNIFIRNNIFFEALGNAFYAPTWPEEAVAALVMDNNCWYQAEGRMVSFPKVSYGMDEFAAYQKDRNKEGRSIVAVPRFLDPENCDFHLAPDSPCIDVGEDLGYNADFEGSKIPQGKAPDIGAYETK